MIKFSKIFFPALAVIFLFSQSGCSRNISYDNVKIKEIIDGDTVELSDGQRARYIGIDTPETRRRVLDVWIYEPQPFAQAAKELNKAFVEGKQVRFEFDVEKKDKYDRLLVYCFSGDTFVNARLLEEGLAVLYTRTPNIKYVDLLVAAQKKAREAKKGIWQDNLVISAKDAKNFKGSIKVVEGRVGLIKETKNILRFNLGARGKKDCQVIIFAGDFHFFSENNVSPFKDYKNKFIRVTGLIKDYKGEPEIIVRHPSQIEILE